VNIQLLAVELLVFYLQMCVCCVDCVLWNLSVYKALFEQ